MRTRVCLQHVLVQTQVRAVILVLIVSPHAFSSHTGVWIRSGSSEACSNWSQFP